MHWLRRGHLFVGLFMIPWVMVYAVTGFLLNHHGIWPEGEVLPITRAQIAGTGIDELPTPGELARDVTDALNARAGRTVCQHVDAAATRFAWDGLPIEANVGGRHVHVHIDPLTHSGHATLTANTDRSTSPFDVDKGLFSNRTLEDQLKFGASALFDRMGLEADQLEVPWLPLLMFTVTDAEHTHWKLSYDPKIGSVKGRPAEEADAERGFKRFLYDLHFMAGYPESFQLRWLWAVFVDATALALAFWCATGVLMWWQIKAVRRTGAAVLVGSIVTAFLLGLAMHSYVVS